MSITEKSTLYMINLIKNKGVLNLWRCQIFGSRSYLAFSLWA